MMLKLENIYKNSKKFQTSFLILKKVSISFSNGKIYVLHGDDISGASDLLNVIGLMDSFMAGTYYIDNQKINNLNDKQKSLIRHKYFGYVYSNPYLDKNLTIYENLQLPLLINKTKVLENKEVILNYLKAYNGEYLLDKYPDMLTNYEKQKVSLIRALLNNPEYILIENVLDEMEPNNQAEYLTYLKNINASGKTIIISSNVLENPDLEIINMKNGQISDGDNDDYIY